MPKFTKKPVTVEAIQYADAKSLSEILFWIGQNHKVGQTERGAFIDKNNELIIATLEGNMRADKGSWIIKGVRGEFYPCDDSIFRETYDKAE